MCIWQNEFQETANVDVEAIGHGLRSVMAIQPSAADLRLATLLELLSGPNVAAHCPR
jgi:hypothetical protein